MSLKRWSILVPVLISGHIVGTPLTEKTHSDCSTVSPNQTQIFNNSTPSIFDNSWMYSLRNPYFLQQIEYSNSNLMKFNKPIVYPKGNELVAFPTWENWSKEHRTIADEVCAQILNQNIKDRKTFIENVSSENIKTDTNEGVKK